LEVADSEGWLRVLSVQKVQKSIADMYAVYSLVDGNIHN
jgi:hypothetical protein